MSEMNLLFKIVELCNTFPHFPFYWLLFQNTLDVTCDRKTLYRFCPRAHVFHRVRIERNVQPVEFLRICAERPDSDMARLLIAYLNELDSTSHKGGQLPQALNYIFGREYDLSEFDLFG